MAILGFVIAWCVVSFLISIAIGKFIRGPQR